MRKRLPLSFPFFLFNVVLSNVYQTAVTCLFILSLVYLFVLCSLSFIFFICLHYILFKGGYGLDFPWWPAVLGIVNIYARFDIFLAFFSSRNTLKTTIILMQPEILSLFKFYLYIYIFLLNLKTYIIINY